MKTVNISIAVILFFGFIFCNMAPAIAQQSKVKKEAMVKDLITSRQYIFFAQSVTPMSGRQRFLTGDNTLSVAKDTVISDLPYFGRAYSAPMNTSEGGIKFTSLNFDYLVSDRKKGGWNITIKPKDKQDVQLLILNVFVDGTASLQVTSNNRQPIQFNGYISGKK